MTGNIIEYFGNEAVVAMSRQFINTYGKQQGGKKALMLTGSPGTGKTYLTEHLASVYKVERILINASAKRTNAAVIEIMRLVANKGRFIVVLDECEAMYSKNIERIIKASKVPLFLSCNYVDKIEKDVLEQCLIGKVNAPEWWVFRKYMEAEMTKFGIPIPKNLDDIAKKAKSFRHANRLIDDPTDEVPEPIETEKSQVEKLLSGLPVEHISLDPKELLNWVNDNARVPDLASKVDIILEHAFLNNYHHWAYAYAALQSVRSNNPVSFPKSFILMSQAKREMKEHKRADRDSTTINMKIDFSKINTTVKTGASLFDGLDELNLDDIK
jgi:hypothetical protein